MKKRTIHRRAFLRAGGLSAAALPLLGFRGVAAAQETPIPKRILFIYYGTGIVPTQWEPRLAGSSEATEFEWEMGPSMASLAPFRDRMIIFENLDMGSAQLGTSSRTSAMGHPTGMAHAMTSSASGTEATGESIDQLISRSINADGPVTRVPYLFTSRFREIPAFSDRAEPIAPASNLRELYLRLFPESLRVDTSGEDDARLLASRRRAAAMDLVRSDHEELVRRLPRDARLRLQAHFDERLRIEEALGIGGGGSVMWPDESILAGADARGNYDFAGRAEVSLALAIAALHADVTRVATVVLDDLPIAGYDAGALHDLHHKANGRGELASDPAAIADLGRAGAAVMETVARALDRLSERTVSDGSPLLDHTLVCVCSQIARGDHRLFNLPWFTVGNIDGYLRTGRYLRFPLQARGDVGGGSPVGRPHGDLWVTAANAMGVGIDRFGNAASTGPIAEMR
ncbi:MAG: DUF1552 domain-containing protein [Myxococcota bacterium]